MSRFPTICARELVKFLKAQGYVEDRQRGSHLILRHFAQRKSVAVPMHSSHDLGRGLALQILKETGFSADDFLHWR
ncbi:MAG: type II toxin-antitoxin system HicA family toxin [Limisphaerales bacterium]